MFPKRWKRAKLACLESICMRFAYEPDTRTDQLSFDFNARAKLWREDYEQLKDEVTDAVFIPTFGGRHKKPPYFYDGMHDNPEVGLR